VRDLSNYEENHSSLILAISSQLKCIYLQIRMQFMIFYVFERNSNHVSCSNYGFYLMPLVSPMDEEKHSTIKIILVMFLISSNLMETDKITSVFFLN
jgi:hypothetical protein